ncbi:MAG: LytTR family DNA-binding domain-containing protein [Gammaproteobacteria bacterium]
MSGSFTWRLVATGVALTVLFTVMAPQSSAPLTAWPRFLFWAMHIGLGLLTAALAAHVLLKLAPGMRDWRVVLFSGLVGVFLFAPLALTIESFFPVFSADADNDWADRLAATSWVAAVLIEALEMAPSYLAAWVVINLKPINDAWRRASLATRSPASDSVQDVPAEPDPGNVFVQRLPPAVGTHIVAVTSDLHYLQVTTRAGQATLLGALKEVEEAFGDEGLRVHRSHWVHREAVVRLRKAGSGWQLELNGGHRVPISRRKRSEVIAILGEDFVRESSAA